MGEFDQKYKKALEELPSKQQKSLQKSVSHGNGRINDFFDHLKSNGISFEGDNYNNLKSYIEHLHNEEKRSFIDMAKEFVQEHESCLKLKNEYEYTPIEEKKVAVEKFKEDWKKAVDSMKNSKDTHSKFCEIYKGNINKREGILESVTSAVKESTGVDLKNPKSIMGVITKKLSSLTGKKDEGGKSESEQLKASYSPEFVISPIKGLAISAIVGKAIPMFNFASSVGAMAFLAPLGAAGILIHRLSPIPLPVVGNATYVDPAKVQSSSFNFTNKGSEIQKGTTHR